jgi:hypothetical protein
VERSGQVDGQKSAGLINEAKPASVNGALGLAYQRTKWLEGCAADRMALVEVTHDHHVGLRVVGKVPGPPLERLALAELLLDAVAADRPDRMGNADADAQRSTA